MKSMIRIEQALYGYDEGHRALAWSFPQPTWQTPRPAAQVVNQSDLTGYMPHGTRTDTWHSRGFPLDPWYVLMRTWHDVEGKAIGLRPGCCWTHALFLPIAAVETLFDYLTLGHLFRRPTRGDYDAYRTPIDLEWPPEKKARVELPVGQREAIRGEFSQLTRHDKATPIVWAGDETAEWFCSYVWRFHVPPERRRELAFHSGAVGPVLLGKRPYDVIAMASPAYLQEGGFYHQHVAGQILRPVAFR